MAHIICVIVQHQELSICRPASTIELKILKITGGLKHTYIISLVASCAPYILASTFVQIQETMKKRAALILSALAVCEF